MMREIRKKYAQMRNTVLPIGQGQKSIGVFAQIYEG
jgi:hypothetical protein